MPFCSKKGSAYGTSDREEYMEKKNKCLEILKTLVSNMWYIVALVAIIAIIFLMIANWGVVLAVIGKFLTILMPFILGFFFACFINPLVKRVH